MIASPLHAADRPCRPKRDHYAGRGYERSRFPARSEIHMNYPERCTFTVLAICGRQGVRARAAGLVTFDTENWALKAKTRLLAILSHRAAALDPRSVIRRDVLPATVFAGSVLPLWRCSRHFLLKLVWPFKAARRLIAGIARIKPLQKSKRRFANPFQVLSLSAQAMGLVAVTDTHSNSEKEMSCVTSLLTGVAKCM